MDSKRFERLDAKFRIGRTPLIRLPAPGNHRLWAKCECANPSGSHYDRVFRVLLEDLEQRGIIVPGVTTLVETTSGNAGISCAFFARELGYACIIFAPEDLPEARLKLIEGYGATVIRTPRGRYVEGAAEAMRDFLQKNRERKDGVRVSWSPNHSMHPLTCTALAPIAKEILADLGSITTFVGAAGNGSTLRGIGQELKDRNARTRIFAFEPIEAANASRFVGNTTFFPDNRPHHMLGNGVWGVPVPHLTYALEHLVEDVWTIKEGQWQRAQQELLGMGHSVGPTSAAAYCLAQRHCRNSDHKEVVILFYDTLDRY